MDDSLVIAAFDGLPQPLLLVPPSGDRARGNRALFELLGLSWDGGNPGEVVLGEVWPGYDREQVVAEEFTAEFSISGERAVTAKLSQRVLPNGSHLFIVLAGQREDEETVNFHSQRLETLGVLAGGIAHDFNNMLTGIMGHVTYLKTILPREGQHVESLRAVDDGARRAAVMIQQILGFSRLEAGEQNQPVDFSSLVQSTCTLLRRAISPQFVLDVSTPSEALLVPGVEARLAQIVVNLVINARDALRDKGTIRVAVQRVDDVTMIQHFFPGKTIAPGEFVTLAVSDTGCGMPKEVQARIFEPYFTTKKRSGTGLGLATVRSIVHELGGAIDVASEVGMGTTMTVVIPIDSTVRRVESDDSMGSVSLPRGRERVLVVDDEDPVRNVIAMSLERLGYSVVVAASGTEALKLFADDAEGIDIVVLDMLMPVLPGAEVFVRLRELNPEIPILVISGFVSDNVLRGVMAHGNAEFLQKPFTVEDLAHRIRRCLDAGAQRSAGELRPR